MELREGKLFLKLNELNRYHVFVVLVVLFFSVRVFLKI